MNVLYRRDKLAAVEVASWPDGASFWRHLDGDDARETRGCLKFSWLYRDKSSIHYAEKLASGDWSTIGWKYHTAPQRERIRWLFPILGAPLIPEEQHGPVRAGTSSMAEDELELYRMLGEKTPFLWLPSALLPWATERLAAEGSSGSGQRAAGSRS